MFILDRQNCSLDFGPGVRYVINVASECTPEAYEVSVDELVSDIKKYPWLSGITLIGCVHTQQQECIELLNELPKYLETRIETDIPRKHFEGFEIEQITDFVLYKCERNKSEEV